MSPHTTESRALRALTPAQRDAALSMGPTLVVAGPGSGKTHTLVSRLVYLIESGLAQPHELCAITFTRKAAAELAERLHRELGTQASQLTVGTFHQLALRLRPLPPAVRLIHEADRHALLLHVLRHSPHSGRALGDITLHRRARRVSEALSLLKGRSCADRATLDQPTDRIPASDQPPWLQPAMWAYHAWMTALDLEDLDDLLVAATQVCQASTYTCPYRFVHVDEYQDTSGVQRELLLALAHAGAQIFAIGDPDQSIYAFRGASLSNFFAFPSDFPGSRICYLRENFRATSTLVDATTVLIRQACERGPFADGPPPQAQRAAGERVQLYPAHSPLSEAIAIAREIERLVGGTSLTSHDQKRATAWASGRFSFSDIAVLTRTAARADDVAMALHREGIPTLRPRKVRPSCEVDVPTDDSANAPGSAASDRSASDAVATRASLADALAQAPSTPQEVRPAGDATSPQERSAYDVLRRALSPVSDDELGLAHESDEWDARFERVAVLTLHGAKGLEFPVVFLCGSEAELLPGRASSPDAIAEERRLFYVGMTRAKDRLWISHVGPRSPFVDALPTDCIVTNTPPPRRAKPPQLKLF